jgi:hypothetical protein
MTISMPPSTSPSTSASNPVGLGNLVFIDYNGNGVYDPVKAPAACASNYTAANQITRR